MVEGAAQLMAPIYALRARGAWTDAREGNMLDGGAPCYACQDGAYVAVAALEPQFFQVLLDRCGLDGPPFADQWDRTTWPAMRQHLAAMFLSRPRQAWCDLLEGHDACVAPVLSMAEAALHPHNQARGTFLGQDGIWQPAPAPRLSRTPAQPATPPR